jgi:hypothetical protein
MLRDVADMVRRVAVRFSREMLTNDNTYGRFECSVFGECPHSERFEVYVITALAHSKDEAELVPRNPYEGTAPILLGNAQPQFRFAYEELQKDGDTDGRRSRVPRLAAERIVLDGAGSVGGSLSLGFVPHAAPAHERNFQLFRWVQPIERGKPKAISTFNGVDVDREVGQVGPCIIGMFGMV